MRRRVLGSIVVAAAILATGFLSTSDTTLARYADVEAKPGQVGSGTLFIGGRSWVPKPAVTGASGSAPYYDLVVTNTGSSTAYLSLTLAASTTSTAFCTTTGGTWRQQTGLFPPTITIRSAATGASADYCALLNNTTSLALSSAIAPNATTTVRLTFELGGLSGLLGSKTDTVPATFVARTVSGSAGGFSDRSTGTLTVTFRGVLGLQSASVARAAATPAPATATAPVAAAPTGTPVAATDVPAECAAAGMSATSFVEKVELGAGSPTFDAARDRPGSAGPFLVLGSAAADSVTGSTGADCIATRAGDDIVAAGGGDDV
ncbi:hypothetical protein, partial [Pseudonocardia pini]|uniref:hypothetical protein n=1 Tax=Pseudonocardia pini TaxID=2758030 RepID=UPI001C692B98